MSVYTSRTKMDRNVLDYPIQNQPLEKHLVNAATGQEIEILYSNGPNQILEIATSFPAQGLEPPFHRHPSQDEFYFITQGSLTLRTKSGVRIYHKHQFIHIKKNQLHAVWNAGDVPACANWRISPALQTETFLRSLWFLANEGKTNIYGIPRCYFRLILFLRFAPEYPSSKFQVALWISKLITSVKNLFSK